MGGRSSRAKKLWVTESQWVLISAVPCNFRLFTNRARRSAIVSCNRAPLRPLRIANRKFSANKAWHFRDSSCYAPEHPFKWHFAHNCIVRVRWTGTRFPVCARKCVSTCNGRCSPMVDIPHFYLYYSRLYLKPEVSNAEPPRDGFPFCYKFDS